MAFFKNLMEEEALMLCLIPYRKFPAGRLDWKEKYFESSP